MSEKRIHWVDFSKGIAIILVIVGHTVNNPSLIRGIIFSFHMPLFFILSGYTSKTVTSIKDLTFRAKKMFTKLLFPAYIIYFIRLPLYKFLLGTSYTMSQVFKTALWASGTNGQFLGLTFNAFGMMWFMVVLFGVRNVYDLIALLVPKKALTIFTLFISILGMIIGKYAYLPFSFDLVMTSLILFHVGYLIKKHNIFNNKFYFIVSTIIYFIGLRICAFPDKYLEMAAREFPLYLLSLLTAIAACINIFMFSAWLEKKNTAKKFYSTIEFLGKNSMIIYIIHSFDSIFFELYKNNYPLIVSLAIRLFSDIIIMLAIVAVKKRFLLNRDIQKMHRQD